MFERILRRVDPAPDVVLRETRWLAIVVIPILAAAFLILYFTPDNAGAHFAWPIKPRMSAMMLGATYLTGVIYFSVVYRAQYWHQIRLGLLPVALFAGILGISTVLHWDRFSHDYPQFWLWTFLYWTLPFVLVAQWLRNERAARPLPALDDEVRIGPAALVILYLLGAGLCVTGLLLFFAPTLTASSWPWKITPLTARVTAAELGLFGFFALEVAAVARWSQVRSLLLPQLLSPVVFVICVFASWDDFQKSNPLTWVFVGFVVVVFVIGFPGSYLLMEARRRGQSIPAGSHR
ncbi:MAG TPA: hypothetical protein VMG60_22685 [Burkholderiaceae bacterium]|nr:hypothetical protein [Burkholderiaceae bacterium]